MQYITKLNEIQPSGHNYNEKYAKPLHDNTANPAASHYSRAVLTM